MATAKQLLWRDVEKAPREDSGVWRVSKPFPLVHRLNERHLQPGYVEPDVELLEPEEEVDALADEHEIALWHARRPRRLAVKAIAALTFVGVVVVACVAAQRHPGARSAVTEWATMGAAR